MMQQENEYQAPSQLQNDYVPQPTPVMADGNAEEVADEYQGDMNGDI